MHRNYIACNVNPLSGLDEEVLPAASRSSRPALVIGGGIAGMQAAIVLAESGTEVTLMEASDRLGGQLILAATPPGKDELKPFLDYLVRQVESLPITVHLEAAFDHAAMTAHQDKEIFVATGARPAMIPIPGADSPHATTAWSILKGTTPVAETAVVVGAGSVGIETALFMAERGAKVTVVEIADKLLPTEVITLKPRMIQELKDHKIDVLLEHAVTGFAAPKATIKNMQDQSESAFATDQLVLAVGSRPDKSIQNLLDAHGIAYKDLGDYQGDRVGLIGDAVRSGYFAFKETP
jgi:NADPH-dependent 2,4-dienoyl-CoA reductase/sulfur reductase-like enzyme